jgi:hypothetical protein
MKYSLMCLALLSFILCQSGRVSAQGGEWGTIKGRITWSGAKIPPQAVLTLPDNNQGVPACIKANNGKLPPDETWIVNKDNKGIKNTFVWLADVDKKPLPLHPNLQALKVKQIEIDQPACHFVPHALALREGQILLVKNSANFQHNFKYAGSPSTTNSGNFIVPAGGQVPVKLETDRLPIKIECTIHPWMNGWARVFNHPYFAVTDENGNFEIKDAPAGNYRLMIWHGSAGWKGGANGRNGDPVQIKAGAAADLGNIESFK